MNRENIRKPEMNDFNRIYDLVIIGGGMIGPSIAHFAQKKLGSKSHIALLEQSRDLGQGTSVKSLEQGRCGWPDKTVCNMMVTTTNILQRPQDYGLRVTPDQLGLTKKPYFWAASTENEIKTYQQLAFILKRRGIDAEFLDLNLAMELCPWLIGTSVKGGMLDRSGFKIDSQVLAKAFAEATPDAQFFIDTPAQQIIIENGRVIGVKTHDGIIKTNKVVIAAGPATRGLVETVDGLTIPIVSLPRYNYYSNNRNPALRENDPFVIVPITGAYWRPERGGILGGFSHKVDGIQKPSEFFPGEDNLFKIKFLTAVWQGLNPKGLTDPDEINDIFSDPLGFYAATYSKNAPFGSGTVSGGYYVHRENAIEDDRPMMFWLTPDIGIMTAFSGHGVMGAPAAGLYGAEIFFGNRDQYVDHKHFGLKPPPSKGISLTI